MCECIRIRIINYDFDFIFPEPSLRRVTLLCRTQEAPQLLPTVLLISAARLGFDAGIPGDLGISPASPFGRQTSSCEGCGKVLNLTAVQIGNVLVLAERIIGACGCLKHGHGSCG